MLDRLRIWLGFIRESDPGAWRCDLCNRWTTQPRHHHGVYVNRPPSGPRPAPAPMPPPFIPTIRVIPESECEAAPTSVGQKRDIFKTPDGVQLNAAKGIG